MSKGQAMGSTNYFLKDRYVSKVFKFLSVAVLLIWFLSLNTFITPSFANSEIDYVYDGDTLKLQNGESVRLVQIDTPELSPNECYGIEARDILKKLIGQKTIFLVKEPIAANRDFYKRLLRYVFVDSKNLNLELVKQGAAAPYFFNGERGKYANQLLKAAQLAKKNRTGLWKECPTTKLDPSHPVDTGPRKSKSAVVPDSPVSGLPLISPGAFCSKFKSGDRAFSQKGIQYTCKTSSTDKKLRWRR